MATMLSRYLDFSTFPESNGAPEARARGEEQARQAAEARACDEESARRTAEERAATAEEEIARLRAYLARRATPDEEV